jgi:hypothetical protein
VDRAEQWVFQIGMAVLAAWVIRAFIVWVREAQPKPDPWGSEVDQLLKDDLLPRTCPRCSAPHEDTAWFCPECGAAVGDYNNCNPYLGAFSLGEVLRTGTFGRFKISPLVVLGYVVWPVAIPISGLGCLYAPVYWTLFALNLLGTPAQFLFRSETPPPLPPPPGPDNDTRRGLAP